MHPLQSHAIAVLRSDALRAEAASRRAALGAAPLEPLRLRLDRRRERFGYLLVEAGLRLAVGRVPAAPVATQMSRSAQR